ncbi:hypothetical protein FH609_013270 [Streptomyces sp. 3MP-14]|uniref:Uncharacterized protein n=1 Tax=Streptomyces mimosae TaxID=2586635 RepID=A0A5N6A5W1_9ACTN|nr:MULTISPECIES: hypothetical protein [Streptomyces]KAB8164184.1 hypothetical protein FH607_016160 [Streptomyces mimosae]KAB8176461.1 hypothetical protein FH609_013270 [Streptomyces sp. 3MP-14]
MSGYGQQQPAAYNQGPYTPPPAAPLAPALPQQIHIAGIVGSALAALGSILVWATAEVEGESAGTKGLEGDGLWTLLLGIVAVGLFAAGMATKKVVLSAAAAAPALIVLVFGVLNLLDPERVVRAEGESEGVPSEQIDALLSMVDVSAGFGLYLVVLGGLGGLAAGAFAATKLKK